MSVGLAVCVVACLLAVGLPRSCGPDAGADGAPTAGASSPSGSGDGPAQGRDADAAAAAGPAKKGESAEEIFERFRIELTTEAERRSTPLAGVIQEQIERRLEDSPPTGPGDWGGGVALMDMLQNAFRDNPEPYLQALFASLSGELLSRQVKAYCGLAHRTQNVGMFETAYREIPPGGNRTHVAARWAGFLCKNRGFEAAHALITETLELPEERRRAASLLLAVNDSAELGLTPEQQEILEPEARLP